MRWIVIGVVGLACGGALWWFTQSEATDARLAAENGIAVPTFSDTAAQGGELFAANCALCHGPHASGSENGPPLVHKIYEPSHHGDGSFYMAAANGVRAHHWRFGAMPKIETVDKDDVTKIIAYVRELQRANGIN